MTNWRQIEEILNEITNQMGGDADKINNGDCAVWAKKAFNALNKQKEELGIEELDIVSNLSFEMEDELEGYDTITPEYHEKISHCYIKIDGWFFDSYNMDGVESEDEMDYHAKCM
jgi:hypothetical protein